MLQLHSIFKLLLLYNILIVRNLLILEHFIQNKLLLKILIIKLILCNLFY